MALASHAAASWIRAIGTELTPEAMQASSAVFRDEHEMEPYRDVDVVRDLKYGPDERNRLDLFTTAKEGERRPVLVFVHGGGFVQGDKHTPGTPYNDNVALFAARNFMVGVNMTYRLAPAHKYPSGPEDMRDAVKFLHREIGKYGGDPDRIFLMGTSAGASHVAAYIASAAHHAGPDTGLAGAILLSGIYDILAVDNPRHALYYGEDKSLYESRCSLKGLVETRLPVMHVLAEHDPDAFVAQAMKVVNMTLERTGRMPHFVHLIGHNHLTASQHLNTRDDRLGQEIVDFVAETAPRKD